MLDYTKKSYKDEDDYTWHFYKCEFNDRGYITTIMSCDGNPQEADIFEAGARFNPELTRGCYKVVNNEVVFDENEYNRILAKEEEERRKPTEQELLEAQVTWTAIATDTLLEPEE